MLLRINNNTASDTTIECCICFRNSETVLWDVSTKSLASLNDFSPSNPNDTLVANNASVSQDGASVSQDDVLVLQDDASVLQDDVLFAGPCKSHVYCVGCLKNIALSFDNHPIGPENSHIPCNPPFDDQCFTLTGMMNFFMHNDIKKILNEEQFAQYSNHVDRYQFPGFEVVKCPRPVYRNGELVICSAGILVSLDDITSNPQGHVVIFCDQNDQCARKSCYHCQNLVGRYSRKCEFCLTMDESNNPKAYNRYFYVVDKTKKDGKEVCYKNEDLTLDIVIPQLLEIVQADQAYVKCLECLVPIYKTEQCNTLTHCQIERCNCCGRSGTRSQKSLGDHWDTTGLKGCPRFDYSKYWNEIARCDFKCQENVCYNNDIGDCNRPDHQDGINNMHQERKKAQVYHAIRSLLPDLKQKVLSEMWLMPELKTYIPQWVSKDHRSFCPDTLRYHLRRSKDYKSMFEKLLFVKPEPTSADELQPSGDSSSISQKTSASNKTKQMTYKQLFSDLYERYIYN